MKQNKPEKNQGIRFLDVLKSAFAALFGIQNSKNRERDFEQGKPGDFIAMGITLVIFLLIGMIILVKIVLSNSGV